MTITFEDLFDKLQINFSKIKDIIEPPLGTVGVFRNTENYLKKELLKFYVKNYGNNDIDIEILSKDLFITKNSELYNILMEAYWKYYNRHTYSVYLLYGFLSKFINDKKSMHIEDVAYLTELIDGYKKHFKIKVNPMNEEYERYKCYCVGLETAEDLLNKLFKE